MCKLGTEIPIRKDSSALKAVAPCRRQVATSPRASEDASAALPAAAKRCNAAGASTAVAPCRRQVATSLPITGGAAGTLHGNGSGALTAVAPSPSEARPARTLPSEASPALPEPPLCGVSGAFTALNQFSPHTVLR